MGTNKPHARGKPQRRDKIKPVIQHNTQPRPTTVEAPHAAPVAPMLPPLAPIAAPQLSPPESAQQDVTAVVMPISPPSVPLPQAEDPAPPSERAAPPPAHGASSEGVTSHLIDPPSPPVVPASHGAGESVTVRHGGQRTPTPLGELTPMFTELRDLFARDRAFASRQDTARCGICYLTFTRDQLIFRETDGFYACPVCDASLGQRHLPMLRRQRK